MIVTSVDAEAEGHCAPQGHIGGYGRPDISGNIIEANAARQRVPSKNINAMVFSLKQTTPNLLISLMMNMVFILFSHYSHPPTRIDH